MTLDELLEQGWTDHDRVPHEVAARLEKHLHLVTDGPGAARLMQLANHAVGDHGADRPRARAICEATVTRLGASPGVSPLAQLAVARFLAGAVGAALAAETRAVASAPPEEALATLVRVRAIAAEGLTRPGDWESGGPLFDATLDLAARLPAGTPADRAIAVVANNVTSSLLELPTRTPAQDGWMLRGAEAARAFWLRAGTWENHERADYLLAKVQVALGRPRDALATADRGLATIAAHGEERVDAAFLHAVRAAALRAAGETGAADAAARAASALAADFADASLKEALARELAPAPGRYR